MPAPRMNVGWLGRHNALRTLLETQGHDVVEFEDFADSAAFEALVISVPQQQIEGIVAALEPHIRRGQMVIHTSIGLGIQVLDPLEVKGALAMAIAHVGTDHWLVSTSDELAQGIAEVMLFESGQVTVAKTDAERAELAPKIVYAQMITSLAKRTYSELHRAIGEDSLATDPDGYMDFGLAHFETSEIYSAFAGIKDPGFRKAYVEAARRLGELEHNMELEMWGLQEELR